MMFKKVNEELEQFLEISDELKQKVADKRKADMDKAIAKYAKNMALNKSHEKATKRRWEVRPLPSNKGGFDVSADLKFEGSAKELIARLEKCVDNKSLEDVDYDLSSYELDGAECLVTIFCDNTCFSCRLTFNGDNGEYIWFITSDFPDMDTLMDELLEDYLGNDIIDGWLKLIKAREEVDDAKAEKEEPWGYFAGGLTPSIYLRNEDVYLYMPCPEEGHDKWELFLDAEGRPDPDREYDKMPTPKDIEKAYKEVHGKLLKMPPFGTAGEDLKAAYEREYGKAEPKAAWDVEVNEDNYIVYSTATFKGDVDNLKSWGDECDDADYDLTASDRDGDSYDGSECKVDLWVRRAEKKKGQECSIRITFPTEDNLWFICPTYAKFTKFLNEVVKNYIVGLEQGMKQLDELVKGDKKQASGKDNMTVCKEVLEHLRKNGGGYINKDQFDDDGHSAYGQIRDWGNWENPSDAADEEDYDWQVLTDSSSKKLDELLDEIRAKYPTQEIECEIGEKNYISITVYQKVNESVEDRLASLQADPELYDMEMLQDMKQGLLAKSGALTDDNVEELNAVCKRIKELSEAFDDASFEELKADIREKTEYNDHTGACIQIAAYFELEDLLKEFKNLRAYQMKNGGYDMEHSKRKSELYHQMFEEIEKLIGHDKMLELYRCT